MQMPSSRKSGRGGAFSSGMGVCVVKPTSVEDGQVIIDTLLDNRTVVVNLEGITTDTAQRIMDITAQNIHLQSACHDKSRDQPDETPRIIADTAYLTMKDPHHDQRHKAAEYHGEDIPVVLLPFLVNKSCHYGSLLSCERHSARKYIPHTIMNAATAKRVTLFEPIISDNV